LLNKIQEDNVQNRCNIFLKQNALKSVEF